MTRFDDLWPRLHRRVQTLHSRVRHRLGRARPAHFEGNLSASFRHPVDASLLQSLRSQYLDIFADAVTTELAEAAELTAHRFRLLGHTMGFGDHIRWSLDPISGRDWPRIFSPDIPYRGASRLGDIKVPWELNKHQYFFTLGKAAWLSGDLSASAEIVRQIDDWIEENPFHTGINWISALETGTRAVSWILAYPFFAGCANASFRQRLIASLGHHMLFVEQHLSIGPFANTHLVGEAAVLVLGGLFLDCSHSRRWIDKGLGILEEEIHRQVTSDGVHAERSVAYHRFFLDQYYLVAGLLATNGRALTAPTLAAMERMTGFLMDVLSPDGTAPALGDNDDARGLWFRADCATDYRGLLALGAVLFDRGDFKMVAGGVTEEVFWLLGPKGLDAFEALEPRVPEHESISYAEAGYYVMRGGWRPRDAVLVFDCGPVGFGPAGHGRADALSFVLHASEYPFLVDAGTFSYNVDYTWREALRSTRSHNVIAVDGLDQSIPRDRMSWKQVAHAKALDWMTTPWFDLVDGEHDGYKRLPDPVAHRRTVIFLKPDLWIIVDVLTARQQHELEFLLHVRPDCRIETASEAPRAVLTAPNNGRLDVWMENNSNWSDTGGPRPFRVIHGSEDERASWFSPTYGTRVPSRALTATQEFVADCTMVTCLSVGGHGRVVTTPGDRALRIHVDGDPEMDMCYVADGSQTVGLEGVRFDGRAFFQRRSAADQRVVFGSRFRELSIEGLLDVRGSSLIDTLSVDEVTGTVIVTADDARQMQITARDGLGVVINGRPL